MTRTCHSLYAALALHVERPATAVHPSDENDRHEFWLMTDDLDAEMAALKKAGVGCENVTQQGWGTVTRIKLPGGERSDCTSRGMRDRE
jgi:hypothetical protein